MLVVYSLRIGIALVCEPHEFAELFGKASMPTLTANDFQTGDPEQVANDAEDHSRQCSCHHGAPSQKPSCSFPRSNLLRMTAYFPARRFPRRHDANHVHRSPEPLFLSRRRILDASENLYCVQGSTCMVYSIAR